MDTKQVVAGKLKKGSAVVFDGKACTVRSVQFSKPGKHGVKKARIEAISMIDSQKIIKIMSASDRLDAPLISKHTAQVLSIQGDKCSVMDLESYETMDLNIPEELKEEIKEGTHVKYHVILGAKVIMEIKNE